MVVLILRANRAQTLQFSNKRKYTYVGSDIRTSAISAQNYNQSQFLRNFRHSQRCYRSSQSSRLCLWENFRHVSRYCSTAIFRKAYRLFETSLYCCPATNRYIAEDLNLNHSSFIYRKLRLLFVHLARSSYSLTGAMEFPQPYIKSDLKRFMSNRMALW